jgi:hypothetical protein
METEEPKDLLVKPAKIISIVFHPLLMPVYGMAIIFSAPTLLGYLPFNVKKLYYLFPFYLFSFTEILSPPGPSLKEKKEIFH